MLTLKREFWVLSFQTTQKPRDLKKRDTQVKGVHFRFRNGTTIAKTDQDKLKQFSEQLNSVFVTKIELKDKGFEQEIGNFLILNIQNYSPLKVVDDHEKLISLNETDRIINNLDI